MSIKAIILIIGFSLSAGMWPVSIQAQTENGRELQKIILNNREYYLHVIQRGEGLYRISQKYGVSMQEILDANDDISESLKVGQILRIPVISGRNRTDSEMERSREFLYHTVEKGQTAFFVSRKYSVPIEVIYQHNPNSERGLVEGSILRIPMEAEQTATVDRPATTTTESQQPTVDADYIYHTVQPRETLFGLSRQYSVSVDEIIEANPALRGGVLGIGSTVRIPRKEHTPTPGEQPSRILQSDDFVYHTIQNGQTYYSISRQYQVSVEALRNANPGVEQDDLKVGYMLRIPRPDIDQQIVKMDVDQDDLYISHRVRRRETLFGISRQYHVDMETIKKVNPHVDFSEFRHGITLRIPKDAWFARRTADVLQPEVVYTDTTDGDVDMITQFGDCSVNRELGYRTPIKVALMLPFSANESNRFFSAGSDSVQVSRDMRNRVNRSRIFAEFYSGVLLALDTLKKKGINIELSVYDIAASGDALNQALRDPSLKETNLIIGPGMSSELPNLSAFSREHKIPLVFPLSNTNPDIATNPYLFHVNTPDSLMFDQMAGEIIRQANGASLLVILPNEQDRQGNRFVQVLKRKAALMGAGSLNYTEYKLGGDDLVEIQSLINREGTTYVVVPSVAEADASRIIPILSGVKDKTRADIRLFGMSDWLFYQTIDPEHIHHLDGTIFRTFGLDYNDPLSNSVLRKFRQWYHIEPHAVAPYFQNSSPASAYSRYGLWGYDVTSYFISAIAQFGTDFDICLNRVTNDQVQFNFNFKRTSNWGGFYNKGLYMLRFRPDYSTERVPLREM
ncbi:PBP1 and LysM peptidoglycan-binding domain-containing protein [Alkalitalea saponilacus]|uniref:ABC-type branched-chain amino acid transport system, substrate-binding protein n=1 Tax=Alkalitalea saponilacus TaxID=889453 RepID=A0A1T5HSX8_9BACT|nr:LysM peptidoglycan-binding domain-containing protein [Alkalitalea saponilacus]ASB50986.1 peptidoglycan-binding protein [Alkalitalea saponilacus]SKC23786.1 ABC-type branched-chain amino acid transport system, substrate-binding protein [Alkalitalea saponilacus]